MKSLNIKTLLNSDNYQSSIETILKKCNHKTQVGFALYCAKGLEQYYDFDKYPEVEVARSNCLELVANWLIDSSSVTKKAMDTAANAAAYAAANAANAAYAAAYAAYAAAYAAANAAANTADNTAAYAADNAAYAAAYAAANTAVDFNSTRQEHLKGLFYYLVKLHLTETDTSFKEETFNLLYLTRR